MIVRSPIKTCHPERSGSEQSKLPHSRKLALSLPKGIPFFCPATPSIERSSHRALDGWLTLLQTTSPTTPLPPAPSDKHSPRDGDRIPATPAPASAGISRANPPYRPTPDTPAKRPHSAARRESCKPWQSPRNPDCHSNRSRHSCAGRKAAATAAPCPDICCPRSPT